MLSQGSVGSQADGGLDWLDEDTAARESQSSSQAVEPKSTEGGSDSEGEEALEKVDIDPLVFSREEFDAGE